MLCLSSSLVCLLVRILHSTLEAKKIGELDDRPLMKRAERKAGIAVRSPEDRPVAGALAAPPFRSAQRVHRCFSRLWSPLTTCHLVGIVVDHKIL